MCRLCVNVYQDFVGISLDWMLVEDRAVPWNAGIAERVKY